jgi:leucyl aminopeptidase
MSLSPRITFAAPAVPTGAHAVLLADSSLALGATGAAIDEAAGGIVRRAAATAKFTGKLLASLDLIAPANVLVERLAVVGIGQPSEIAEQDWARIGGAIMAKILEAKTTSSTVILEVPGLAHGPTPDQAADVALGLVLRAYDFDRYKSKREDDDRPSELAVTVMVADPKAADEAWARRAPIADGIVLARDLVNEPANALGPVEFAERAMKLADLGLGVEVLGEPEMRALKMNALLGVAQGSARPPRLVVLTWNGGPAGEKPVLFVGKGVVFDTGGISIKPAQGMEDMKGDMGGAAAVTGLLAALAGRKAKVNAVGVLGIVENMPDGAAQRPGDVVTARSGTTIEIINTDAEGRLVLADALHYAIERFEPKFAVDLATLTGAIIVALGNHHAGMFSNDDGLAEALAAAGTATGERVWRMPLGPDYDKLIESKVADIKNTGGRHAGAVTAAQFLKRFVGETPWAHLDIAGTAMGSPQTETNRSWSSGFGVRLLDRLVADKYEGRG